MLFISKARLSKILTDCPKSPTKWASKNLKEDFSLKKYDQATSKEWKWKCKWQYTNTYIQ